MKKSPLAPLFLRGELSGYVYQRSEKPPFGKGRLGRIF